MTFFLGYNIFKVKFLPSISMYITQTCLCNMQRFLKAVKMIILDKTNDITSTTMYVIEQKYVK